MQLNPRNIHYRTTKLIHTTSLVRFKYLIGSESMKPPSAIGNQLVQSERRRRGRKIHGDRLR